MSVAELDRQQVSAPLETPGLHAVDDIVESQSWRAGRVCACGSGDRPCAGRIGHTLADHTYSELWHFSPLTLTLIYATYAFGVLTTLLLAGGVSDDVGRRPVLLVALSVLMVSTVLFVLADSAAWLFVARGLQGLATGAALSAASAALLDLHPRRDTASVGLTNGVAAATGIGVGMLVSSALVQLGSAPRVLPYLVLLVLFAIAFGGAYWMPEPVNERRRLRLTWRRPSVPPVVRRPFFLAGLAVLSSWSIGGLFFHLGLQSTFELFGSIVAGIALIVAVEAWRTRPAQKHIRHELSRQEVQRAEA